MSRERPSDANAEAFEMSVEPAPKTPVIEAEEDEESKRQRDAALASTFDPERVHAGKSNEEMIAEREAQALALVDAAIVAGIAIAIVDANEHEAAAEETADTSEDGGD